MQIDYSIELNGGREIGKGALDFVALNLTYWWIAQLNLIVCLYLFCMEKGNGNDKKQESGQLQN